MAVGTSFGSRCFYLLTLESMVCVDGLGTAHPLCRDARHTG